MRNAPDRTGGTSTAAMRPAAEPESSTKPPYSPVPSLSVSALAPCWNWAWAEMMFLSVATAAVSLADKRAASRFGMAMAAMMAMIAMTIISSMRVKPFWLRDMGMTPEGGWFGGRVAPWQPRPSDSGPEAAPTA